MKLFRKAMAILLAVLTLIGIAPISVFAADNVTNDPASDGAHNGGYYESNSSGGNVGMYWKASLYVALNDTVHVTNNSFVASGNKLTNLNQWAKLGDSIYITEKSSATPKRTALFTKNGKVDYLGNSSTPGGVGNSVFHSSDNYTTNPTILRDTSAPLIPNIYDGVTNSNKVISYFGDTQVLLRIMNAIASKAGTTAQGLLNSLSFTIDGITMTGSAWQGKKDYNGKTITLLPNTNGTNAVAYTIVYEPVVVVNLRDNTYYRDANGFGYRAVAFTATELAIAQAKGLINMHKNKGNSPYQNMNKFFNLFY